jgi:hypothetical protein
MSETLTRPDANRPGVEDTSQRHRPPNSSSDEDALDKIAIAEISPIQISQMTCNEMVRVIRAAKMPLLRKDVSEHLELYDRDTLERLVYLARRCCRNQGY